MKAFNYEDLTAWAERKRVRSHLTDGRADAGKCTCAGDNGLAAQVVADYFNAFEGGER